MALDDLLAALRRESREEQESVLRAAQEEAERIEADARAGTSRLRAEALERAEREQRGAVALTAAQVRHAAHRGVLEARQKLLDTVFAEASRRLAAAAAGPAYRATLPVRFARVRECVGEKPAQIICPPGLAGEAGAFAATRPGWTVLASDDAAPGFLVRTCDGTLDVDATLAGELERRRPDLAIEILAALDAGA